MTAQRLGCMLCLPDLRCCRLMRLSKGQPGHDDAPHTCCQKGIPICPTGKHDVTPHCYSSEVWVGT